jgi:cbb3-type cytochrome oxidase subunit 3
MQKVQPKQPQEQQQQRAADVEQGEVASPRSVASTTNSREPSVDTTADREMMTATVSAATNSHGGSHNASPSNSDQFCIVFTTAFDSAFHEAFYGAFNSQPAFQKRMTKQDAKIVIKLDDLEQVRSAARMATLVATRAATLAAAHGLAGQRAQEKASEFNRYATSQTASLGLLDIALLTANITLLANLTDLGNENHRHGMSLPPNYTILVGFLIASIGLQFVVFCLLGVVYSLTLKEDKWNAANASRNRTIYALHTAATLLIGIVTFVQIIIAGFGASIVQSASSPSTTTTTTGSGR